MAYLKAVHKSQFKGRLCVSTFYHSVATLKRKCFRIYKPAVIREAGVADNATYVERARGVWFRCTYIYIVTIVIVLYICVFLLVCLYIGIFSVMFHPLIYCVEMYHLPQQCESEECMVLDRCGGIMALHKLS